MLNKYRALVLFIASSAMLAAAFYMVPPVFVARNNSKPPKLSDTDKIELVIQEASSEKPYRDTPLNQLADGAIVRVTGRILPFGTVTTLKEMMKTEQQAAIVLHWLYLSSQQAIFYGKVHKGQIMFDRYEAFNFLPYRYMPLDVKETHEIQEVRIRHAQSDEVIFTVSVRDLAGTNTKTNSITTRLNQSYQLAGFNYRETIYKRLPFGKNKDVELKPWGDLQYRPKGILLPWFDQRG